MWQYDRFSQFEPPSQSQSQAGYSPAVSPPTTGKRAPAETREYLRVYETLPCQMLNAYGSAKHPRLSDGKVWSALGEKQESGALWTTEYASENAERRGVALS